MNEAATMQARTMSGTLCHMRKHMHEHMHWQNPCCLLPLHLLQPLRSCAYRCGSLQRSTYIRFLL
jgi:hypothetical protein